jgi:DNA-binding transcriptional MerR regulator
MKIGQLAKRTGIPARMLRYYEEQGLITPQRLANGYRDYDDALVQRADKVRCFLDAGVPSRLIGGLLDSMDQALDPTDRGPQDQLRAVLEGEWDRLTERIDALDRTRSTIKSLLQTI